MHKYSVARYIKELINKIFVISYFKPNEYIMYIHQKKYFFAWKNLLLSSSMRLAGN